MLSLGIRKNHKKESGATLEEGYNEMEITKDGDSYEGKDVNATHVTGGREDVILDKDEKHAQSEEEEKKAMATTIEKDQENQAKDAIKEMDAEPIELEELLSLMKVCPRAPSIEISSMYLQELITIYHSPRCLLISRILRMNISIGMKSWTLVTPSWCVTWQT